MSDEEMLTLDQSDDCFIRTRKICKGAGLVDLIGIADSMARIVKTYMDLDKSFYEEQTTKQENNK